MTDEKQEQKSYIYIEFVDATSLATTKFEMIGISPFQLFAFAKYFEIKGEQLLMHLEMQQQRIMQEQAERTKIVVPKPKLQ